VLGLRTLVERRGRAGSGVVRLELNILDLVCVGEIEGEIGDESVW
jgi:hypothetical protein